MDVLGQVDAYWRGVLPVGGPDISAGQSAADGAVAPGAHQTAAVAHAWLEGTYSERYPDVSQDAAGMQRLFRQFSLPRRHPEPCRAGDTRLHPRGRRAELLARARARWLETAKGIPWRLPLASLNYLLSSHVWRQDHNGFSHQDPGFLNVVVNKKTSVVRVYLPPDANALLSVGDHCLRRGYAHVGDPRGPRAAGRASA